MTGDPISRGRELINDPERIARIRESLAAARALRDFATVCTQDDSPMETRLHEWADSYERAAAEMGGTGDDD